MSSKKKSFSREKKKRTTIKDIAAAAGVSIRTVSLVLNNTGRISGTTREKVLSIAKALDYRPNILARGLVSNKTYLLGVNIPYLDLSFINTIITGMEQKCIELQYELLLTSMGVSDISFSDYDVTAVKDSLERLILRRADGIACFPAPGALPHYRRILDHGIPLIQLLRPIPELPCPSITVDNKRGMYLAVKHLLDSGRRHLGFLSSCEPNFLEVKDRFDGFVSAHEDSGLKPDLERCVVSCDQRFFGGYEAAKELFRRCPKLDAIVSPTDYAAIGAIRACLDMRKNVPEEISVIGYDDMDFAELQGYKSLSTVRQPKRDVGFLAVDFLYRMIQGEAVSSVVLEPELVLRESTV